MYAARQRELPAPYVSTSIPPSRQILVYILSTAPWKNTSGWSDKLEWVKRHLGEVAEKRLILTPAVLEYLMGFPQGPYEGSVRGLDVSTGSAVVAQTFARGSFLLPAPERVSIYHSDWIFPIFPFGKIALRIKEEYGIRRIGVFGSRRRGDAKPESDLDILVELGVKVDLVNAEDLRPGIAERVMAEVSYL